MRLRQLLQAGLPILGTCPGEDQWVIMSGYLLARARHAMQLLLELLVLLVNPALRLGSSLSFWNQ
jgi:hypothetical protein